MFECKAFEIFGVMTESIPSIISVIIKIGFKILETFLKKNSFAYRNRPIAAWTYANSLKYDASFKQVKHV